MEAKKLESTKQTIRQTERCIDYQKKNIQTEIRKDGKRN